MLVLGTLQEMLLMLQCECGAPYESIRMSTPVPVCCCVIASGAQQCFNLPVRGLQKKQPPLLSGHTLVLL